MHVFVDGRHSKDILRSIAHELIHHKQNLEGRLNVGGYSGPGYYLENDKLKEVEHEAMLEGNATMREYEDTVKYTETKNMSLKEWKNNELNQLLMKKFGILKEEKKNMVKDPKTGEMVPDYAIDGKGDDDLAEEVELEEAHCMGKRDEDLEEGRGGPKTYNSDKFVGHEDRYQADRIHEEEELQEGEVEESVRRADGAIQGMGNNQGQKTPEELKKNLHEDELEEMMSTEPSYEDTYATDEEKAKMKAKRADEKSKAQELKEAINKITKAKRIFLNNKRIK